MPPTGMPVRLRERHEREPPYSDRVSKPAVPHGGRNGACGLGSVAGPCAGGTDRDRSHHVDPGTTGYLQRGRRRRGDGAGHHTGTILSSLLRFHTRLVSPPRFRCGGRTQCQRRSLRYSQRAGKTPWRSLRDAGAWNLGRRHPGAVERTRNSEAHHLGSKHGLVASRSACVPSLRWYRRGGTEGRGRARRLAPAGGHPGWASDPDRQRHRNELVQAGRKLALADERRPGMESRRRRCHQSQSPARVERRARSHARFRPVRELSWWKCPVAGGRRRSRAKHPRGGGAPGSPRRIDQHLRRGPQE